MLKVCLLTLAEERLGVKTSLEELLRDKYRGGMKEFLKDRQKVGE